MFWTIIFKLTWLLGVLFNSQIAAVYTLLMHDKIFQRKWHSHRFAICMRNPPREAKERFMTHFNMCHFGGCHTCSLRDDLLEKLWDIYMLLTFDRNNTYQCKSHLHGYNFFKSSAIKIFNKLKFGVRSNFISLMLDSLFVEMKHQT